jgi:hypothetical protein
MQQHFSQGSSQLFLSNSGPASQETAHTRNWMERRKTTFYAQSKDIGLISHAIMSNLFPQQNSFVITRRRSKMHRANQKSRALKKIKKLCVIVNIDLVLYLTIQVSTPFSVFLFLHSVVLYNITFQLSDDDRFPIALPQHIHRKIWTQLSISFVGFFKRSSPKENHEVRDWIIFSPFLVFFSFELVCTWFAVVKGWGKSRGGRARKSSWKKEREKEEGEQRTNTHNKKKLDKTTNENVFTKGKKKKKESSAEEI